MGRLRVLEAGAGAADRLGDVVNRLVLADDLLVQGVLHVQEALRLLGGDARDRDAGPHRDDFGDVLFGDVRLDALPVRPSTSPLHAFELVLQLDLAVAELGGALVLLGGDGLVLLLAQALEPLAGLLVAKAGVGALDAHAGRRLVDEVDRLVGQEAVGDVARGELGGGLERFVA